MICFVMYSWFPASPEALFARCLALRSVLAPSARPAAKPLRINTCTTATKQTTLSLLESTLTQKPQGGPPATLPGALFARMPFSCSRLFLLAPLAASTLGLRHG